MGELCKARQELVDTALERPQKPLTFLDLLKTEHSIKDIEQRVVQVITEAINTDPLALKKPLTISLNKCWPSPFVPMGILFCRFLRPMKMITEEEEKGLVTHLFETATESAVTHFRMQGIELAFDGYGLNVCATLSHSKMN